MEKIRVLCSDKEYTQAIHKAHSFLLSKIDSLPSKYASSFKNIPQVEVIVDSSMIDLAGQADSLKFKIRLNYHLLKGDYNKIFKIYLHEFCHLIADKAEGKHINHGSSWKKVMGLLGQVPEVCHSYDYSRLKPKEPKYKCSCSIHTLSPKDDKLVLSGKLRLICPNCNSTPLRQ